MPLTQDTILSAIHEDVAEFVANRAREAAGTDALALEWWFYNFGVAYFGFAADVQLAAQAADEVLFEQPYPPLDQPDSAFEPAGFSGV